MFSREENLTAKPGDAPASIVRAAQDGLLGIVIRPRVPPSAVAAATVPPVPPMQALHPLLLRHYVARGHNVLHQVGLALSIQALIGADAPDGFLQRAYAMSSVVTQGDTPVLGST
jgi:hypothetical protein